MTKQNILAGWASAEITPDLPCRMGGYAARTAPARAVHDALSVQALALGTTMEPLLIVLCDLVAADSAFVASVRRRVQMILPEATVWAGATHTHSGPDTAPFLADSLPDPALLERTMHGVIQAATIAVTRMHPVEMRWASGPISGIATNRDHPERQEMLTLDLLCLYDDEPERQVGPAAIFGSFPCHPTVLSAANLEISADLPGAFRDHLGALLMGQSWIALASGAAGDISTRHMRQGQGFPELARLGADLARQAYALITQAQPIMATSPILQRQRLIALEGKDATYSQALAEQRGAIEEEMRAAQQAGRIAHARTLETTLQGLDALENMTRRISEQSAEVAVARAGELTLVAIPGELYHSLGTEIQQVGGSVLVLGYTNGYVGYLPTRAAYSSLDYEVLISPFGPGCGEQIRDAAIAVAKTL